MFTRDPNLIKALFLPGNKPSQTAWNNFFDFMASIEAEIGAAYAMLIQPVNVVADEAARLAVGPATHIGWRVKQLDNGITYIKQVEDGTLDAHWEAIGDTYITIPDVDGAQAALDEKLVNDADDSTDYRLRMANHWCDRPVAAPGVDALPTQDVLQLNFSARTKYYYHEVDREFTVTRLLDVTALPGLPVYLLVRNLSAGAVDFVQPADLPDTGLGAALFRAVNGAFPFSLSSGAGAVIKISQVPIPAIDPEYPSAGAHYYFIEVEIMEPPVVLIGPAAEADIGLLSHGFYEGEYYPPHAEDLATMGFALTDSLYEAAASATSESDAGSMSFAVAQGLYEEVVLIETLGEAASMAFALTASAYTPVIQTAGPYSETIEVAVVLSSGNHRDSSEATGLISEDMVVSVVLAGGAHA